MNLPPHLQNLNGMMFPNSNNIQLNPNNLSAQTGINQNANLSFTNNSVGIVLCIGSGLS